LAVNIVEIKNNDEIRIAGEALHGSSESQRYQHQHVAAVFVVALRYDLPGIDHGMEDDLETEKQKHERRTQDDKRHVSPAGGARERLHSGRLRRQDEAIEQAFLANAAEAGEEDGSWRITFKETKDPRLIVAIVEEIGG
jgi:hypothetical protein